MAASIGTDSDLPGIENGGGEPGNTTVAFFPFQNRRLKRVRECAAGGSGSAMGFAGVLPLFAFAIRFPATMGAKKIPASLAGTANANYCRPISAARVAIIFRKALVSSAFRVAWHTRRSITFKRMTLIGDHLRWYFTFNSTPRTTRQFKLSILLLSGVQFIHVPPDSLNRNIEKISNDRSGTNNLMKKGLEKLSNQNRVKVTY